MNDYIEERVSKLADYIVENKATVRAAAKCFNISKSTVHKDVSARLAVIDPCLHREVQKILLTNKSERHIRGGNATKLKYKAKKEKRNGK